jgi:hypothetical protein
LRPAIAALRELADRFGGRALIVGKGPSMDVGAAPDPSRLTVGLNQVSRHRGCHVAFIIDETLLDHDPALGGGSVQLLVTPRVGHRVRRRIGQMTVFGAHDRPVTESDWYPARRSQHAAFNLASSVGDPELGAVIPMYNFSAPVAAHLLAEAGFTDIRLEGIDGGTAYHPAFADVEQARLQSMQDSYDVQFDDLRLVKERCGVRFSTRAVPRATVMIGGEAEQALPEAVLRWSLESRTFLHLEYVSGSRESRALYATGRTGTPFSLQRMFLPRLSEQVGRGLYLDSDMLVLQDVSRLFHTDLGGHVLLACAPTPGRAPQYSVFLVDNARASWDPDALVNGYLAGTIAYDDLIGRFAFAEPRAFGLPATWNHLETYEAGRTANVHFTDMGRQPWLSVVNPLADLWCEALLAALDADDRVAQALETSLAHGWVRPSLAHQVERGIVAPWRLPGRVLRRDDAWMPPHVRAARGAEPGVLARLVWQSRSWARRQMARRGPRYVRHLLAIARRIGS